MAEDKDAARDDGLKADETITHQSGSSANESDESAQQGERTDDLPSVNEQTSAEPASDPSVSADSTSTDSTSADSASAHSVAEQTSAEPASVESEPADTIDDVPELSELDEALLKVAQLEEQLARRNADLYNVQQEYNGYVKRSKAEAIVQFDLGKAKVLEGLIPVLDNAHLAREHGELDGPAGKVVDELEHILATNFSMERFGAVGDAFDPAIHEALMHSTSADVESEQVNVVMQPGYRTADKVLRPARVGVVSPQ